MQSLFLQIFLEQLFSFLTAYAMGKYLNKNLQSGFVRIAQVYFYHKSLHIFSFTVIRNLLRSAILYTVKRVDEVV
jgi:hypothetical protein